MSGRQAKRARRAARRARVDVYFAPAGTDPRDRGAWRRLPVTSVRFDL